MNHIDVPKMTFMSNKCNYLHNMMPFSLNNAHATYQRLIDALFSNKIGSNLEIYIDDMVLNIHEWEKLLKWPLRNSKISHKLYLKDVLSI